MMARLASDVIEMIALTMMGTMPHPTEPRYAVGHAAYAQWEKTCLAFINRLKDDNPGFSPDLFLAACRGKLTTEPKKGD